MKHFTPSRRSRNARTFIASLLSYLLLVGQVAPVTLAAGGRGAPTPARAGDAVAGKAQELKAAAAAPVAPAVLPGITATKVDTFDNTDGDGKAEPGQDINYAVTVANNLPGATDATGVQFTDDIDANAALDAGSVTMSPLALNDTYSATKDTQLVVADADGVLDNDNGLPPPTATAIAAGPTTAGGTVTLNAGGGFTYDPPAGFVGADTFTYTATNSSPETDSATVTINVDARPVVTDTTPDDNATQVASDANVVITFSEPVDVTGEWFSIACATSGTRNVAATVVTPNGTDDVYTINPNADFANGELCTVTVVAAQVADQDANDPPDNPAADFVFDFTIDTPPAVSATSPANGAADVAGAANVVITFDEPVTVAGEWFAISCPVSGNRNVAATVVTPNGTNDVYTINPNADFAAGETCTVTVNAANVTDNDTGDPPNNMAANHVFSFTIDAAPAVLNTTPADNAVNQAGNVDIVVTFSEPVDVTGEWFAISCPTSGSRNVAATVVTPSAGNTVFTINPNADFAGGETCTVTIDKDNVADQDTNDPPNNMAADHVFDFTIDTGPTVTDTTPDDNAVNQANNVNVVITFDEPVDVTGEWFGVVCALSGTHNVAAYTVTPSAGNTVFTLAKNSPYINGETCTVTINAANVADQDGNDPPDNMSANFVFDFKIDLPPIVLETSPANGAGGSNDIVAPNTNITVTFDEPVNATTNSFKVECPAGSGLVAYTLSASPSTVFTLDPVSDLPIGTICTVTVVAAEITDADAGDPPDNLEADHVFTFKVPPQANPDARGATGNVRIQTAGRSGFSLLTNDIGPGIVAVVASGLSTHGGQFSVAADGTFSYNPPAGFTGTDTFPYTISNVAGTDIGTVTITVAGMVWFINNQGVTCVVAGCGRLTTPFTTLEAFESFNGNGTMNPPLNDAVVSPEAGDHIFIYTGSGSYVGPLTLENDQRVVGQGATSAAFGAGSLTGIVPAADSDALPSTGGTKPTIGTDGFNVVSNNQLYGLNFSTGAGNAVESIASIGTFVFGDVTVTTTSGNGIDLDNGGTVTSTGINTVSTTSGVAVDITNTTIGGGNVNFQSINKNGNNSAITLANTGAGTFNVNGTGTTAGSGGTIENIVGSDAITLNNTDGRVTLKNMIVEDISSAGDASDGFNTRSGVDAIHGQLVDGGLTLDNVTIRRISDSAINGTPHGPISNLSTATSWVGLVLNNCTLENTNRFHVANRGDETEEGIVRIRGLSGTVNVQNTEFENGARGMDIFTPNSGSLDITVQASEFLTMNKEITGQPTNRVGNWGFYLRGMGSATAVVRLGDPAEANPALGNTFLNNPLASVVIEQDSSAVTGSIIASVSRNTFTVTDHLSPDEEATNGIFDGNFPQGGVLFRPFGGTIEAIFAGNTFNDAMHANGAVGQLGLIADTGSDSEFIIRNNTFNGPWDFITEIRADGNTSCAMLWQNNSFPFKVLGPAEIDGTELEDIGLTTQPLPFEAFFTDVRNGGQLDLTIQNETIPDHDRGFATFANSFIFRTQATGGVLDLEMDNNKATNGYRFSQTAPSVLNLFRDGSAQATAQLVLRDNGNRGGNVNPNTDPPVVNISPGVVTLSATDPTLPSITIPPQPAGPMSFASFDEDGGGAAAKSQAFEAQADASAPSGEPIVYNNGPVQHSAADMNLWAMRRVRRGSAPAGGDAPNLELLKNHQQRLDQANPPASMGAGAVTAPAASTPAPAGRVWSDMPTVIIPAPRVNAAPEAERDGEAEGDDAEENDAAKESDAAEPEKKPAKKGRVTRTETYRPKEGGRQAQPEQSQPEQAQPEQPGFRNISYAGPLGSAPSRGVRFARASFTPAGDRSLKAASAAPAAKAAPKALARTAPLAAAAPCSPSATQVCVDIGTLPAGKSVVIRFKVTVDSPFEGAQEQISNQGSVSYAESITPVLTDDPSVAGVNDPTVTPVAAPPDIVVHDAEVPEPKSGSTNMNFTITLSRNPPANVTVDFTTEDEPAGPGKAEAGSDYTATSGQFTFVPGQRVLTVSVPVLHNAPVEPDETFKLKLTGATGGQITVGEATGTIRQNATPGAILISEVRTNGPAGPGDDFVEIYNNSDTPAIVPAGGWGLFKMGSDCNATPVLIGTIPAGTIPARSHYLFVGSQYSLADYGGTGAAGGDAPLVEDIETDRNVALFSTTDVAQLSSLTKLDAVGFGTNNQGNCNLLREGNILGAAPVAALEYSYFRKLCGFVNGVGCQTDGTPLDTQDNANDFTFADTAGTAVAGTGERLGAPGPENASSPVQTNLMTVALLDSSAGGPAPPNRMRNHSDVIPGVADAGTMSIRRRVINNTGAPVSRLRFRISEMTTYPPGPGQADMRALTGLPLSGVSVTNDSGTCGGPSSCTVNVEATTLEQELNQPAGGGLNATLTVTLGTPLAAGDHVLVHFYLGVKQTGLFRFYIVTETLP
ncbi:MAG TPA: Ig-like domain-containing protein [Pyrinomonadaceae bacterium]|nr:Ig-like domain-containing protein [Pyrinomonadaceae bacterium]